MQPWFTVYFFDIGHPCYDQLTSVKTRYPLTSITWPYLRLKFKAHRGQVFFEVDRWPIAGFFSIASRAHVRLTCWKQGRIVRKPVNANPGSKVNQILTFSSFQMFLLLCFVYMAIIGTQNRRPKQYTGNLSAKLQNSNQNFTFSWVRLIGLWTTRPRSYAFRLAEIYIFF